MMDLYTWGTPNGHKVHIMLMECEREADCRVHAVNINDKQQLADQVSPLVVNPKIPFLVDRHGADNAEVRISESGAILIYLAEKYQRFLATEPLERFRALQWLMFQMSAVGPMMGQLNHFRGRQNDGDAYAVERFSTEVLRLHDVMEKHLTACSYFAGGQYSIADMAIFPWIRLSQKLGIAWQDHPHLHDWYERVLARPAVQRALLLPHLTLAA